MRLDLADITFPEGDVWRRRADGRLPRLQRLRYGVALILLLQKAIGNGGSTFFGTVRFGTQNGLSSGLTFSLVTLYVPDAILFTIITRYIAIVPRMRGMNGHTQRPFVFTNPRTGELQDLSTGERRYLGFIKVLNRFSATVTAVGIALISHFNGWTLIEGGSCWWRGVEECNFDGTDLCDNFSHNTQITALTVATFSLGIGAYFAWFWQGVRTIQISDRTAQELVQWWRHRTNPGRILIGTGLVGFWYLSVQAMRTLFFMDLSISRFSLTRAFLNENPDCLFEVVEYCDWCDSLSLFLFLPTSMVGQLAIVKLIYTFIKMLFTRDRHARDEIKREFWFSWPKNQSLWIQGLLIAFIILAAVDVIGAASGGAAAFTSILNKIYERWFHEDPPDLGFSEAEGWTVVRNIVFLLLQLFTATLEGAREFTFAVAKWLSHVFPLVVMGTVMSAPFLQDEHDDFPPMEMRALPGQPESSGNESDDRAAVRMLGAIAASDRVQEITVEEGAEEHYGAEARVQEVFEEGSDAEDSESEEEIDKRDLEAQTQRGRRTRAADRHGGISAATFSAPSAVPGSRADSKILTAHHSSLPRPQSRTDSGNS